MCWSCPLRLLSYAFLYILNHLISVSKQIVSSYNLIIYKYLSYLTLFITRMKQNIFKRLFILFYYFQLIPIVLILVYIHTFSMNNTSFLNFQFSEHIDSVRDHYSSLSLGKILHSSHRSRYRKNVYYIKYS